MTRERQRDREQRPARARAQARPSTSALGERRPEASAGAVRGRHGALTPCMRARRSATHRAAPAIIRPIAVRSASLARARGRRGGRRTSPPIRSADEQHFLELRRDVEDRAARLAQCEHLVDDEAGGARDRVPTSAAPRRAPPAGVPISRATTIFCWLPPESVRAGASGPGARIPNSAMRSRASSLDGAASSQGPRRSGGSVERAQREVVGDGHVGTSAGRRAVGRDVGEAGGEPRGDAAVGDVGAVESDGARARARRRPAITSASSAWPLPSTPAIARISPARSEKLTPAQPLDAVRVAAARGRATTQRARAGRARDCARPGRRRRGRPSCARDRGGSIAGRRPRGPRPRRRAARRPRRRPRAPRRACAR